MAYLKKDQLKIFFETHGEGPALLLIAGLASDSQSWQFILKKLAAKFKVIVFDNRGTGRTQLDNNHFTISDMARDAADILDHLGIACCHVIGHSMGGCIAQELAYRFPEKINQLVLASTTPTMSDRNKSLFDYFIDGWKNGTPQEHWFRGLFYWLFSPTAFLKEKFLDAAIIYAMCYPYQQTQESFKAQIDALIRFNSSEYLSKITADTLVISGAKDILVYPDESALLKSIPGFNEMIILENAAHSIHAEYPDDFLNAVLPFLEKQ